MIKKILTISSMLLLLLSSDWVAAQCGYSGQVVQPSNNANCGKLVLSFDTWELLVPTDNSLLEGVEVNQEILFSYELDTLQTPSCTAGPAIQLTCVTPISGPSQGCQSDFSFTANFDEPLPIALFEPVLNDYSATYQWDFGDGEISSEHTVSHTFSEQGEYEVCLSVSGGSCGDLTTTCQVINLTECQALFYYEANDGVVDFFNQSSGGYEEWRWSLGNGNEIQNANAGTYNYGEINIYTVCLEVWSASGCSSKFCNYVFTGSGDVCDFTTCVYPGDTNEDGAANVYDLLPIGVGFGAEGPPRQLDDVTLGVGWFGQYAPDWGVETINGSDYKHLDCNGDGEIDSDDAEAIEVNYAAPSNIFMVQAPGSPTFWLDFEWDTILIDDNTPPFIKLEADLMAGTASLPIQDMTGFALQVNYPNDMVKLDGVEVDYYDNSFLGNSNQILWLQKDRYEDGRLDLGIVKKAVGSNGFGKVATLSFIVISDVLGRTDDAKTFSISLSDVVAVNPDGAMLTIGSLDPATVYIVDKTTATQTNDQWLNNQVHLFPNPASDKLSIQLDNLRAESLSVFNPLGQQVITQTGLRNAFDIDVAHWESGIYLLKIKTDKGVANKRVVVR